MNRGIIFVLGMALGAVGGALLTYRKVTQLADEEIELQLEDQRAYYKEREQQYRDEIAALKGEVSTINEQPEEAPPKELSKASYQDYIQEHEDVERDVKYHAIVKQYDTETEETPKEPAVVRPKLIDENTYEISGGYKKQELYLFDSLDNDSRILINENEEYMDFEIFSQAYYDSPDDVDVFYCRDPLAKIDYKVNISDKEYYRGVVEDIHWQEGDDDV